MAGKTVYTQNAVGSARFDQEGTGSYERFFVMPGQELIVRSVKSTDPATLTFVRSGNSIDTGSYGWKETTAVWYFIPTTGDPFYKVWGVNSLGAVEAKYFDHLGGLLLVQPTDNGLAHIYDFTNDLYTFWNTVNNTNTTLIRTSVTDVVTVNSQMIMANTSAGAIYFTITGGRHSPVHPDTQIVSDSNGAFLEYDDSFYSLHPRNAGATLGSGAYRAGDRLQFLLNNGTSDKPVWKLTEENNLEASSLINVPSGYTQASFNGSYYTLINPTKNDAIYIPLEGGWSSNPPGQTQQIPAAPQVAQPTSSRDFTKAVLQQYYFDPATKKVYETGTRNEYSNVSNLTNIYGKISAMHYVGYGYYILSFENSNVQIVWNAKENKLEITTNHIDGVQIHPSGKLLYAKDGYKIVNIETGKNNIPSNVSRAIRAKPVVNYKPVVSPDASVAVFEKTFQDGTSELTAFALDGSLKEEIILGAAGSIDAVEFLPNTHDGLLTISVLTAGNRELYQQAKGSPLVFRRIGTKNNYRHFAFHGSSITVIAHKDTGQDVTLGLGTGTFNAASYLMQEITTVANVTYISGKSILRVIGNDASGKVVEVYIDTVDGTQTTKPPDAVVRTETYDVVGNKYLLDITEPNTTPVHIDVSNTNDISYVDTQLIRDNTTNRYINLKNGLIMSSGNNEVAHTDVDGSMIVYTPSGPYNLRQADGTHDAGDVAVRAGDGGQFLILRSDGVWELTLRNFDERHRIHTPPGYTQASFNGYYFTLLNPTDGKVIYVMPDGEMLYEPPTQMKFNIDSRYAQASNIDDLFARMKKIEKGKFAAQRYINYRGVGELLVDAINGASDDVKRKQSQITSLEELYNIVDFTFPGGFIFRLAELLGIPLEDPTNAPSALTASSATPEQKELLTKWQSEVLGEGGVARADYIRQIRAGYQPFLDGVPEEYKADAAPIFAEVFRLVYGRTESDLQSRFRDALTSGKAVDTTTPFTATIVSERWARLYPQFVAYITSQFEAMSQETPTVRREWYKKTLTQVLLAGLMYDHSQVLPEEIPLEAASFGLMQLTSPQNIGELEAVQQFIDAYRVYEPSVSWSELNKLLTHVFANREKRETVLKQFARVIRIKPIAQRKFFSDLKKSMATVTEDQLKAYANGTDSGTKLGLARAYMVFLTNDAELVRTVETPAYQKYTGVDVPLPNGGLTISQLMALNDERTVSDPKDRIMPLSYLFAEMESITKGIRAVPPVDSVVEAGIRQDIAVQRETGAYTAEITQNSRDATRGKHGQLTVDFYLTNRDGKEIYIEEATDNGTGALQELALLIPGSTKEAGSQREQTGFFGTGKFTIFQGVDSVEIVTNNGERATEFTVAVDSDESGNPISIRVVGIRTLDHTIVPQGVSVRRIKSVEATLPELDHLIATRAWRMFAGMSQFGGTSDSFTLSTVTTTGEIEPMIVEKKALGEAPLPALTGKDASVITAYFVTDMPSQIVDRAGLRVKDIPDEFLALIPKGYRKYIDSLNMTFQIPLPLIRSRGAFEREGEILPTIQKQMAIAFYRALARRALTETSPQFVFDGLPMDWETNDHYDSEFSVNQSEILRLARAINEDQIDALTTRDLQVLLPIEGAIDPARKLVKLLILLQVPSGATLESERISLLDRRMVVQWTINQERARRAQDELRKAGVPFNEDAQRIISESDELFDRRIAQAESIERGHEDMRHPWDFVIPEQELTAQDRSFAAFVLSGNRLFGVERVVLTRGMGALAVYMQYEGKRTIFIEAGARNGVHTEGKATRTVHVDSATDGIAHEAGHLIEPNHTSYNSVLSERFTNGFIADASGFTHDTVGPFADAMKYVAMLWFNNYEPLAIAGNDVVAVRDTLLRLPAVIQSGEIPEIVSLLQELQSNTGNASRILLQLVMRAVIAVQNDNRFVQIVSGIQPLLSEVESIRALQTFVVAIQERYRGLTAQGEQTDEQRTAVRGSEQFDPLSDQNTTNPCGDEVVFGIVSRVHAADESKKGSTCSVQYIVRQAPIRAITNFILSSSYRRSVLGLLTGKNRGETDSAEPSQTTEQPRSSWTDTLRRFVRQRLVVGLDENLTIHRRRLTEAQRDLLAIQKQIKPALEVLTNEQSALLEVLALQQSDPEKGRTAWESYTAARESNRKIQEKLDSQLEQTLVHIRSWRERSIRQLFLYVLFGADEIVDTYLSEVNIRKFHTSQKPTGKQFDPLDAKGRTYMTYENWISLHVGATWRDFFSMVSSSFTHGSIGDKVKTVLVTPVYALFRSIAVTPIVRMPYQLSQEWQRSLDGMLTEDRLGVLETTYYQALETANAIDRQLSLYEDREVQRRINTLLREVVGSTADTSTPAQFRESPFYFSYSDAPPGAEQKTADAFWKLTLVYPQLYPYAINSYFDPLVRTDADNWADNATRIFTYPTEEVVGIMGQRLIDEDKTKLTAYHVSQKTEIDNFVRQMNDPNLTDGLKRRELELEINKRLLEYRNLLQLISESSVEDIPVMLDFGLRYPTLTYAVGMAYKNNPTVMIQVLRAIDRFDLLDTDSLKKVFYVAVEMTGVGPSDFDKALAMFPEPFRRYALQQIVLRGWTDNIQTRDYDRGSMHAPVDITPVEVFRRTFMTTKDREYRSQMPIEEVQAILTHIDQRYTRLASYIPLIAGIAESEQEKITTLILERLFAHPDQVEEELYWDYYFKQSRDIKYVLLGQPYASEFHDTIVASKGSVSIQELVASYVNAHADLTPEFIWNNFSAVFDDTLLNALPPHMRRFWKLYSAKGTTIEMRGVLNEVGYNLVQSDEDVQTIEGMLRGQTGVDIQQQLAFNTRLSRYIKDESIDIDKLTSIISRAQFTSLRQTVLTIKEVTAENWLLLLNMFIVAHEPGGAHLYQFTNEMSQHINMLFASNEAKDLVYRGLQELWRQYLNSGRPEELPYMLIQTTSLVGRFGNIGPLSQVEALTKYIGGVIGVLVHSDVSVETSRQLFVAISRMESRFVKEKWSRDEVTDFYNIMRDILHADSQLSVDFFTVFETLTATELKQFVRELFPLYRTKLSLLESRRGEASVYAPEDLVQLRGDLGQYAAVFRDTDSAIELHRTLLLNEIKRLFQKRFGIKKIPEPLTVDQMRSVRNFSTYLGNLNRANSPDKQKQHEATLGFYLALVLNGEWEEFRRGLPVVVEDLLIDENAAIIKEMLSRRLEPSPLTAESLGIAPEDMSEFTRLLQQETSNVMLGEVETIDIKLANIIGNLRELEDLDLYEEPIDKKRMQLVVQYGNKRVGAVLSKMYQEAIGKTVSFTHDDEEVKQAVVAVLSELGLTGDATTIKGVFQDGMRPFATVVNLITYISETGMEADIHKLRKSLEPSEDIIQLFKRLGENFTPSSGALAVSQDLNYLEQLIVKREGDLTEQEKLLLTTYVTMIRNNLIRLQEHYEKIKDKFASMKAGSQISNEAFKVKLGQIEHIILSQEKQQYITSAATSNFNSIIENMRQCLSCTSTSGINNDTDLTFGEGTKFYLYSQADTQKTGSISDEIVFVTPVTYSDGTQGVAFVFDQVYGTKTPSVLINQVLAVMKKYRTLHERFPGIKLSVFVTDAATASVGTSMELFMKQVSREFGTDVVMSHAQQVTVQIKESIFADHYVEFGGLDPRLSGARVSNGLVVKFKNQSETSTRELSPCGPEVVQRAGRVHAFDPSAGSACSIGYLARQSLNEVALNMLLSAEYRDTVLTTVGSAASGGGEVEAWAQSMWPGIFPVYCGEDTPDDSKNRNCVQRPIENRLGSSPTIREIQPPVSQIVTFDNDGVRAFYAFPNNPNVIVASTWSAGTWKTIDGGKTWEKIGIVVDDNVARDFIALPNGKVMGLYDHALYIFDQYSRDWEQIELPTGLLPQTGMYVDGTVIVGGMNGTYMYNLTDGSWTRSQGVPTTSMTRTITVDAQTGKILAGVWDKTEGTATQFQKGYGIYSSSDGGLTFVKDPLYADVKDIQGPLAVNTIVSERRNGHAITIIGGEGVGPAQGRIYTSDYPYFFIMVDGKMLPMENLNIPDLTEDLGNQDLITPQNGIVITDEMVYVSSYGQHIVSASLDEIFQSSAEHPVEWDRLTTEVEAGDGTFYAGHMEYGIDPKTHDEYIIASGQDWTEPKRYVGLRVITP